MKTILPMRICDVDDGKQQLAESERTMMEEYEGEINSLERGQGVSLEQNLKKTHETEVESYLNANASEAFETGSREVEIDHCSIKYGGIQKRESGNLNNNIGISSQRNAIKSRYNEQRMKTLKKSSEISTTEKHSQY